MRLCGLNMSLNKVNKIYGRFYNAIKLEMSSISPTDTADSG
jgi:hypothetical protein